MKQDDYFYNAIMTMTRELYGTLAGKVCQESHDNSQAFTTRLYNEFIPPMSRSGLFCLYSSLHKLCMYAKNHTYADKDALHCIDCLIRAVSLLPKEKQREQAVSVAWECLVTARKKTLQSDRDRLFPLIEQAAQALLFAIYDSE